MLWRGRELDARRMWDELGVSIPETDDGTFSRLLFCPNPEHSNTRSPSFQVNLRQPLCHCFARCGIEGTSEHAVQVILGCSEKDARKFMLGFTQATLGIDVDEVHHGAGTRKTITGDSALAKDVLALQRQEFSFLPKNAIAYLEGRGIDQPTRGLWQIGWDEDCSRVVVPARDHRGIVRFLIRRAIGRQQPKYLYTDGAVKSSILFGLLHVPDDLDTLVLVEGSFDTIHMQAIGGRLAGTVGTLGSGLSDRQVRLIHERNPRYVVTSFDNDQAGIKNTLDAYEKLGRFPIQTMLYPKGRKDPAELLPAEALRQLDRAVPRHEFLRRLARLDRTIIQGSKRKVYA